MPRDCDCECHYDLALSTRTYIESLGDLNEYQDTLAETALSLAHAMGTALAAAPVAKELRSTLDALRESVGDRGKVNPLDELAARRAAG